MSPCYASPVALHSTSKQIDSIQKIIPFMRTSTKKLLQDEDFMIIPLDCICSSSGPSSRYVESLLEDKRLLAKWEVKLNSALS